MCHDRNTHVCHFMDNIRVFPSTFKLDRLGVGFFQKASRIDKRCFLRCLIGQKRHVRNHQGLAGAADDGLGMTDHVFHGDWKCRVIAQNNHSQRITDEEDVNVAVIQDRGHSEIIGRQHGYFLFLLLHFFDVQNGLPADFSVRTHVELPSKVFGHLLKVL